MIAFANLNPFITPKPNRLDVQFLGISTVVMILFFIGYLLSSTLQNFGTIYFYLTAIIFIFWTVALATKFNVFSWVIYGATTKLSDFGIDVAIGIALAIVLNIGLLASLGFSISIPLLISGQLLSATSASQPTINTALEFIVLAFYGPLVEELFWIGAFVPSFIRYLKPSLDYILLSFLILFSLTFIFLGSQYIGLWAIGIGVILMVLSLILQTRIFAQRLHHIKLNKFPIAMIFGGMIITTLHVYAYGNIIQNIGLFAGAFLFFTIEGVIDYYRKSIVPSIISHTTNNAIIGASTLYAALTGHLLLAVAVIFMMVGYLLWVFRLKFPPVSIGTNSPGRFVRSSAGAYN